MKIQSHQRPVSFIFISLITLVISGVLSGVTLHNRFSDADASKAYECATAYVIDSTSHEHEDSDGDSYYRYSALLSFSSPKGEVTFETDDFFSKRPKTGSTLSVMYLPDDPSVCYVARHDWMTDCYLPYDESYDMMLFTAAFFLSFSLMVFGAVLSEKKAGKLLIGLGLLLLGVSGVITAFTEHCYPLLIIALFGACGILVLYQTLFVPPQKLKEMEETNENLRLLIVRDIFYPQDGSRSSSAVIFALIGDSEGDEAYFSYITSPEHKFQPGNKYSLDLRKIAGCCRKEQIVNYMTTDISILSPDDFQELSPAMKLLLSSVH